MRTSKARILPNEKPGLVRVKDTYPISVSKLGIPYYELQRALGIKSHVTHVKQWKVEELSTELPLRGCNIRRPRIEHYIVLDVIMFLKVQSWAIEILLKRFFGYAK